MQLVLGDRGDDGRQVCETIFYFFDYVTQTISVFLIICRVKEVGHFK